MYCHENEYGLANTLKDEGYFPELREQLSYSRDVSVTGKRVRYCF